MRLILFSLLPYVLLLCQRIQLVDSVSNGAIVLSRNGVPSASFSFGVVRVYYNGWGNICDDFNYGFNEANVICHQLGYATGSASGALQIYGTDTLPTKWDNVVCGGSDYLSIAQCTFSTSIDSGCVSDSTDATVTCSPNRIWNSNPFPGMIRLQGGAYSNEGRVEVYCNGQWGTICSGGFDSTDANTICKQLGYDSYYRYNHLSLTGGSNHPIWITEMYSVFTDQCVLRRNACPVTSGTSCAGHSNAATVECRESSFFTRRNVNVTTCSGVITTPVGNGAIRLYRNGTTSSSYYYGIVQVFIDNEWGNICYDTSYDSTDANVICHQLGYAGASSYSRAGLQSSYGTDFHYILIYHLMCASNDYLSIAQCSYSTVNSSGCPNVNSYDATVSCYTTRIWDSSPFPGMICLRGGAYSSQGRVEVYCNGRWGRICSSGFSTTDANTLCKQLGYDSYHSYNHLPLSNNFSQPIWSASMASSSNDTCFGTRNTCPVSSFSACTHSDVILECRDVSTSVMQTVTTASCFTNSTASIGNVIIRLYRNGATSSFYYYGIVQVFIDNKWGNICHDTSYDSTEANVICHQLGYTGASSFSRAGLQSYGTDYSSTLISNLMCASESYLTISQCSYSTVVCPNDDATVYCYTTRIWDSNPFPGIIRLQGGLYSNEGRVEVYCNGQWGTICNSGFDSTDAIATCRQLGYNYYEDYNHLNLPGSSSQLIWATYSPGDSNDTCFGTRNICQSTSVSTCSHSQDVTVRCTHNSSYSSVLITTLTCRSIVSYPDGNGVVRLFRSGMSSSSYYYGIVQVFVNSGWGNICYDTSYNTTDANVICHQLGYTGASSYSRAGLVSYGTDSLPARLCRLSCNNNDYLTVLQCSYSTSCSSSCTSSYDATVNCYTTRIWDNSPFPGMIRLQDGFYSNQGRVEVYCNGQWGTICNSQFNSTDANTICKQLGYTNYTRFDHLSLLVGTVSQPIWLTNIQSRPSSTCIGPLNSCPSSRMTFCSHLEDITIACSYSTDSSNSATVGHCNNNIGPGISAIAGAVGGSLVGIVVIILLLCCCVCCVYCAVKKTTNDSRRPYTAVTTSSGAGYELNTVSTSTTQHSSTTTTFTAAAQRPITTQLPPSSTADTNPSEISSPIVAEDRPLPPSYANLPPASVGGYYYFAPSDVTKDGELTEYPSAASPYPPATATAAANGSGATNDSTSEPMGGPGGSSDNEPSVAVNDHLRDTEPPRYNELYQEQS